MNQQIDPALVAAMKSLTQDDLLEVIKEVAARKGAAPPVLHPYPLNEEGIPEYRTVMFTCDHLMLANTPDLGIQKMVFSTEEPFEAALNLHNYYGDLITPDVMATIIKVREEHEDLALVHFVPQRFRDRAGLPIFHVIMSAKCYQRIWYDSHKGLGSNLLTRNYVLSQVEQLVDSASRGQKRLPSMLGIAMFTGEEDLQKQIITDPVPQPED